MISPQKPLTSRPTEGDCRTVFLYHIDTGAYGEVKLDGLNTVVWVLSQGPLGPGAALGQFRTKRLLRADQLVELASTVELR